MTTTNIFFCLIFPNMRIYKIKTAALCFDVNITQLYHRKNIFIQKALPKVYTFLYS